jgi:phosphoribosyl 1,2-cyclic phosphodiesterase
LFLDAGTGIRPLGQALSEEFAGQPLSLTLLITHSHWDHIQGFPFFRPAYEPGNHIRILGYEGAREGLAGIFSAQMESPYFPIGLGQLPGHLAFEEFALNGVLHRRSESAKRLCQSPRRLRGLPSQYPPRFRSLRTPDLVRQPTANEETTWLQSTEERA